MTCFLSSFRYSETEFSSLLKYARYGMASSYSGYTTVTFLKAEKRQNSSPCCAQPPAEPSSKAPLVSSPLYFAQSLELAAYCPYSLLCLLSHSQRLQFCSFLWLLVLRLWQETSGLQLRFSSTVSFQRCLGVGCSRDDMSRARTAWDTFSCFSSQYNCPVISPALGSPSAIAWKGTVFIYTSLVQAVQHGGRGQGATVIYTP